MKNVLTKLLNKLDIFKKQDLFNAKIHKQVQEISRDLYSEVNALRPLVEQYKKMTSVDIDVLHRAPATVVVTGVMHNKPFVNIYDTDDSTMEEIVNHLNFLKKNHRIRHIDDVPGGIVKHMVMPTFEI